MLAQRAACRINPTLEGEPDDPLGDPPPVRRAVQLRPGEQRLEQMHVRVGELRRTGGRIGVGPKSHACAQPVRDALEQLIGARRAARRRAEQAVRFGEGEQHERLLVKQRPLLAHLTIGVERARISPSGRR